MCNLSQVIRDAEDVKIILNMHKKGYTSEQIADIVEKKRRGSRSCHLEKRAGIGIIKVTK